MSTCFKVNVFAQLCPLYAHVRVCQCQCACQCVFLDFLDLQSMGLVSSAPPPAAAAAAACYSVRTEFNTKNPHRTQAKIDTVLFDENRYYILFGFE